MSNLDELLKLLNKISKSSRKAADKIAVLEKQLERVDKQIIVLRDFLWSNAFKNSIRADVLSSYNVNNYREILHTIAMEAIHSTEEYNYDLFITGFETAINNVNILVRWRDTPEPEIKIFMDKIAGTLPEYAAACDKARKIMKIGRHGKHGGIKDADLATHIWYEKIYSTGRLGKQITKIKVTKRAGKKQRRETTKIDVTEKYAYLYRETIKNRMRYFTHYAPWWKLLDEGNIGAPSFMTRGGIGGYPAPTNSPTRFISRTKQAIINELKAKYNTAYLEAKPELRKIINDLQEQSDVIIELIKELGGEVTDDTFIITINLIERTLGPERLEFAKQSAIENFAKRILSGEEVGRTQLGHPKARIRTVELLRQLKKDLGLR
jgi:hypothetical protein